MIKFFGASAFFLLITTCYAQENFTLEDYLKTNAELDQKVDSVFFTLNENSIVAQLIMPAIGKYGSPEDTIKALMKADKIGGVLLLNGTKDQFLNWSTKFEKFNKENGRLPFLYSADAEPTLVNKKMLGSTPVKKAVEITTVEQVTEVAETISNDLLATGVNYNFAPVVDVSANKTVGYRGFGSNPKNIVPFSLAFIEQTQKQNIVATAKHFPGHGLVSGDTHSSLQSINGELKELSNYPPLIEAGVLSIMVAHIAVKNNPQFDTKGMPATLSKTIVTDLLRDSLNFQGLIVTDAMNMGGVVNFSNCYVKAIEAGCDILLMPKTASLAHAQILKKYKAEEVFKKGVDESAKRIIRMKICLGLIN